MPPKLKARTAWEERFARAIDLNLDLPGILFVEAAQRIERGATGLVALQNELTMHATRVTSAGNTKGKGKKVDAWVDVIQGVGGLESRFGATVGEFAVADVVLVAAAEAYANAVATHILSRGEYEQFEKLSPVGKWLFLPRVMKLKKWTLTLDKGCLQQFAQVVARRNRIVHPRVIRVKGIVDVEKLLKQLLLDARLAKSGLQAVVDLIRGLSLAWRGSYGPDWLDPTKAAACPPCFYLGSVEVGLRLGKPGKC